jgi:type II secretory pathway predicted ATPase ExeA
VPSPQGVFDGNRHRFLLTKLRNDLRNPNMEEIGNRTTVFSLEGVTGS